MPKRQAQIQERLANAMTELLPLTERVQMAFEKLALNEQLIRTLGQQLILFSWCSNMIEYGPPFLALGASIKFGFILMAEGPRAL